MSNSYLRHAALAVAAYCALIAGQALAVQRAYVSALSGADSNTSFNCDVIHPCRFFQAATTVVDPNGEVVVLDSGGYGAVTISNSISLVSPAGVYAGISVFPGADGITIATPSVNVILRGLTINGQGGNNGINMTAGGNLVVDHCTVANFAASNGILVDTAATVRIIDTALHNNGIGIRVQSGAVAYISRSTVTGSASYGILAYGNVANVTTTAAISETGVVGSGSAGIYAFSDVISAISRVSIIRSSAVNGNIGILAESSQNPGTGSAIGRSLLTISESLVTGNSTGWRQGGPQATFRSLGNNSLDQNSIPKSGTIITDVLQ
jgi:hypothetical protein